MKKRYFIVFFIFFLCFVLLSYYETRVVPVDSKDLKDSIGSFQLNTNVDYSNKEYPLVGLDWSDYGDSSNSIFKGYQSKDGGVTWESISLMDYTSVRTVRVLNIYPEKGDGLEEWMEVEKDTTTNEVIGKGIIQVDKVSISNFNRNPSTYLKKTGADWNYDVLVFGFWDRNNYFDLSTFSKNVVNQFIQDGYGVVFGHDTGVNNSLSRTDTHEVTDDTAKTGQNNFTEVMLKYLPIHWEDGLNVGSTEVEITKKGLLTQYPWNLGEVGTKYTIPMCHSWGQVLDDTSNIWMKFNATEDVPGSNFYIVTNNNVAMIQTGHSSGQSMQAEQKIIANLIFYCYQLTSDTNVIDYSGMDVSNPNPPTSDISGGYNGINIDLDATDVGNHYQYYIEGYTKPDMSIVTSRSNVAEADVVTGIKGYYYIIDDLAENNFSKDDANLTLENSLSVNFQNHDRYLHVRSVDYAGNLSDVYTKRITLSQYDLTLDLGGGSYDGSSNPIISLYYEEPITLNVPIKEDYVFSEWTKDDSCSSILNGNQFTMKDACKLTAVWKEDFNHNGVDDDLDPHYLISYQDGVDESVFTTQSYTVLSGLATPNFDGELTRYSYLFSCWSPEVSSLVEGNVNYIAQWSEDFNHNGIDDAIEEKYVVTYQDGVDGSAFSTQSYSNLLIGLDTPSFNGVPTRYRYLFHSWNPVVSSIIRGNAVYTAVWDEDFNLNGIPDDAEEKYTIVYQDGVSGEVFSPVTYDNLLIDLETPLFTGNLERYGYLFAGWSPSVSNTIQGNAIYVATWTLDENHDGVEDEVQPKYIVRYVDGCDQTSFNDKVIDNVLVGMETPSFDGTPVREDYIFVGWNPSIQERVDEDVVYTAEWVEDFNHNGIDDTLDPKYTVTFKDGKNGTIFKDYQVTVLQGMKVEFDNTKLVNDDYQFVGWDNDITKEIVSDTLFIAKWTEIIHNVPDTANSTSIWILFASIGLLLSGGYLFFRTKKNS